jgi:hypothetical protein
MPEIKEIPNEKETPQTPGEIVGRGPEKITDLKEDVTIPREIKRWMEKLEEDPSLNQGNSKTTGDDDSVLKPIATTVTKITLPTNRASFTGGFSKPVNQAWRWLSEFVLRIIKKSQGNVKFKEE